MTSIAPRRAGAREWAGLAVLALPTLLLTMDLTVLHLAVPHLSADLAPSSSQLLWITDIYGFLIAGFLITMGTLGDRIGRRRLLLIGAAAFAVALLFAAYSTSAEMLIAARAVLGIAGATLMPSTLALIRNMFHDPAQRSFAIGLWMISFMVGGAIGPLVGGILLENFWWGSVFLMGVPVMALLLVTGPVLLPEYRDPAPGRLDVPSAALSLAAVLAVIYGIKDIAENGTGWLPVLSVTAGLTLGAVFVRRQRTLRAPLLDLGLFAHRAFSVALVMMTLSAVVMVGFNLFIAQYLQLVLGLSPLRAGLWTLPLVAGMMLGTMLASVIVRRVRPAFVIGAGMAIAAVGFGTVTQIDATGGLAVLVAGSLIFGVGLAPAGVLGTDIVVGAASPERAGGASAISETSNEFGGALGLAVLGSIGVAVYRSVMAGAVPAGVPDEAAEAARDTLGGAVPVAERLPDGLGAVLLDIARDAFTQGMQLTAAGSAVILAGAAVLAVTLLRDVRPSGQRQPAPEEEKEEEQEAMPADDASATEFCVADRR